MAVSPDQRGIVDAAMLLRAAAPDQWIRFCQELNSYSAQMLATMLAADPTMLVKAQGMATATAELARICREAPKLQEQFHEAMINGKRDPQQRRPAVNPGTVGPRPNSL